MIVDWLAIFLQVLARKALCHPPTALLVRGKSELILEKQFHIDMVNRR